MEKLLLLLDIKNWKRLDTFNLIKQKLLIRNGNRNCSCSRFMAEFRNWCQIVIENGAL